MNRRSTAVNLLVWGKTVGNHTTLGKQLCTPERHKVLRETALSHPTGAGLCPDCLRQQRVAQRQVYFGAFDTGISVNNYPLAFFSRASCIAVAGARVKDRRCIFPRFDVLVATDVIARGVDFADVNLAAGLGCCKKDSFRKPRTRMADTFHRLQVGTCDCMCPKHFLLSS